MKVIAFYLPQFHPIPENDAFWGKGFTEWVNVRNAKPLFPGHEQPVVPLGGCYYNLLDPDVLRRQAEMAKEYGVYGFCLYHYWTRGRMLLEKPVNMLLADPSIRIHFCLSWANHSWTDSWKGTHQTLVAQEYGGREDWDAHFNYLLPFFQDPRYITSDGKPLLLIFNPEDIPDLNKMLDYWQMCAQKAGLVGLSFAYQNYWFGIRRNRDDSRFDYGVEHQPAYAFYDYRSKVMMAIRQYGYKILSYLEKRAGIHINKDITRLEVMDYDRLWQCILKRTPTDGKRIPGAFSGWDSTPRKGRHGLVVLNANAEKFGKYLSRQIVRAKKIYRKDMLFVAAWNEWAEGSMLEPDEKNGYAYLESLRCALDENGENPYTAEKEES